MNHCGGTNPSRSEHTTRKVLLSWFDVRAMTMKGRTQSRWRFKRPAATHDLLIHFVRRADRWQYYDCAALCSAGRSLRVIHCLKNLLDSFGALKSNQREISHGGSCPYSGRTSVPKVMLYATQMRAG